MKYETFEVRPHLSGGWEYDLIVMDRPKDKCLCINRTGATKKEVESEARKVAAKLSDR